MIRITLTSLLIALLLGGCTTPGYFEPKPIVDKAHNGMLYLYRPAASNPGAKPLLFNYPDILLNGDSAGIIRYNQYLALELPAGQYQVTATGLSREASWEPKDVSYSIKIEAGAETFMKLRVEYNVQEIGLLRSGNKYFINLFPIERSEAIYEIRDTDKGN